MKKIIFLFSCIVMAVFTLSSCQTYRYSVSTDKQIAYLEKQISLTERKIFLEKRKLGKKETSTMLELHKQNLVNYSNALTEAIKASGGKQLSIRSNNAYGSAMFVGVASVKTTSLNKDLTGSCNLLIQNRFLSSSRQLDEKNTTSFKIVSVEVVGINKSKLVESNTWGLKNISPTRSHEISSGQLRPEENLVVNLPAGTYIVYFYRLGKSHYKTLTLNPMHNVFVSDKDLAGTGVKKIHGFACIKRK